MTPIPVLFFIIVVQILAFQFLSIRLTRAFPQQIHGAETLSAEDAGKLEEFQKGAGRSRFVLGVILLLLAALAVLVFPFGYREEKITLAIVSIASSLGLVFGFLSDRRRFVEILDLLPESRYRVASLRRRRLRDYYAPAWELVPVLIILATIALTIWIVRSTPSTAGTSIELTTPKLWIFPLLQIAILGVLTTLGISAATKPTQADCLTKTRIYNGRPEEALHQVEHLRRAEVAYLLMAKVGVLLLLGISQMRNARALVGMESGLVLGTARWIVVFVLFILFARYLWGILRVRRTAER